MARRHRWLLGAAVTILAGLPSASRLPATAGVPTPVAGVYSNVEYGVRTVRDPPLPWRTGRNTLMPWLYLLEDSSYVWGRDRGRYEVRGNQLLLSGSYRTWGPGSIDRDRRIIFNFRRPGQDGTLQEFLVVMGYRGSLREYPPPR